MTASIPLYTPLSPDKKYPVSFEKTFKKEHLTIGLRPLSLPADWGDMGNWYYDEFSNGMVPVSRISINYMQETFSAMLQCDFAQPFMGLLNNSPAFVIEIYDGRKQADGMEEGPHVFEQGDHIIRLVLSQTVIAMPSFAEYALLSSLDYFFSYLQVNRIVWELNEKDQHYTYLANRLRFSVYHTPEWPDTLIFLYTRENFNSFIQTYLQ
jgi:hypothetical protein